MDQKTVVFREEWVFNPDLEALWYYDEEGRDLYEIDLERVNGSAGILDWIMQIFHKAWATPRCVHSLIQALDYVSDGIQGNFCSCQKDKPNARAVNYIRHKESGWRFFPMPEFKTKEGPMPMPEVAAEIKRHDEEWAKLSESRVRQAGLIEEDPGE